MIISFQLQPERFEQVRKRRRRRPQRRGLRPPLRPVPRTRRILLNVP